MLPGSAELRLARKIGMNMTDISHLMLKFKDAIRHSWNTYFVDSDAPMSSEIQEAFRNIEIGLFRAIVLAPLGVSEKAEEYRKHPLSFIIIKPIEGVRELPLQFGDYDASGSIVWRMPATVKVEPDMTFEFFDYFDWYSYGYIDLHYVRARARAMSGQQDFKGKIVLIEQDVCRFFFPDSTN